MNDVHTSIFYVLTIGAEGGGGGGGRGVRNARPGCQVGGA